MIALKKIWNFLKTHWYLPIVAVIGVLIKGRSNTLEKINDIKNESEQKQQAAITEAEAQKKAEAEVINKEYERVVGALENSYKKKQEDLKEETKKDIKKLVKKHYNNPREMSSEISKVLGLQHVQKNNDSSD